MLWSVVVVLAFSVVVPLAFPAFPLLHDANLHFRTVHRALPGSSGQHTSLSASTASALIVWYNKSMDVIYS